VSWAFLGLANSFRLLQIKDESFLEDISNLLNSGEVPNLFTNEEKIEVQEKMAQIDKQRDKAVQTDGSPVALFNFFVTVGSSDKIYITFLFHPLLILSLRKVFKAPKLDLCYWCNEN